MDFSWVKGFKKKYNSQQSLIENLFIPALIDSYSRVSKISGIKTFIENHIRDEFHIDLEENNPLTAGLINDNTLQLTNENRIPKTGGRTDLGFFISGYGTLIVECKRLHSAESRYITDGLERFTTGFYSEKDSYGGLMGFVIDTSCTKVCNSLKNKVSSQSTFLNKNALLLSTKCGTLNDSFQSNHSRTIPADIHLYHLFFELK